MAEYTLDIGGGIGNIGSSRRIVFNLGDGSAQIQYSRVALGVIQGKDWRDEPYVDYQSEPSSDEITEAFAEDKAGILKNFRNKAIQLWEQDANFFTAPENVTREVLDSMQFEDIEGFQWAQNLSVGTNAQRADLAGYHLAASQLSQAEGIALDKDLINNDPSAPALENGDVAVDPDVSKITDLHYVLLLLGYDYDTVLSNGAIDEDFKAAIQDFLKNNEELREAVSAEYPDWESDDQAFVNAAHFVSDEIKAAISGGSANLPNFHETVKGAIDSVYESEDPVTEGSELEVAVHGTLAVKDEGTRVSADVGSEESLEAYENFFGVEFNGARPENADATAQAEADAAEAEILAYIAEGSGGKDSADTQRRTSLPDGGDDADDAVDGKDEPSLADVMAELRALRQELADVRQELAETQEENRKLEARNTELRMEIETARNLTDGDADDQPSAEEQHAGDAPCDVPGDVNPDAVAAALDGVGWSKPEDVRLESVSFRGDVRCIEDYNADHDADNRVRENSNGRKTLLRDDGITAKRSGRYDREALARAQDAGRDGVVRIGGDSQLYLVTQKADGSTHRRDGLPNAVDNRVTGYVRENGVEGLNLQALTLDPESRQMARLGSVITEVSTNNPDTFDSRKGVLLKFNDNGVEYYLWGRETESGIEGRVLGRDTVEQHVEFFKDVHWQTPDDFKDGSIDLQDMDDVTTFQEVVGDFVVRPARNGASRAFDLATNAGQLGVRGGRHALALPLEGGAAVAGAGSRVLGAGEKALDRAADAVRPLPKADDSTATPPRGQQNETPPTPPGGSGHPI